MNTETKRGYALARIMATGSKELLTVFKEEAKKADVLFPYQNNAYRFNVLQESIVLKHGEDKIAMITADTEVSDSLKNTYGNFFGFDELKDIAENCEISVVGLAPGGKNAILLLEEREKTATVEVDTSKGLYKTLADVEKKIVNEGILTQMELDERIAYLNLHGVTAKKSPIIMILILLLIHPQVHNIEKPKKLYVPTTKGESLIMRICRNLALGDPVILEGPKSVGKNVAWESISWLLNRPMEVLNCSARMTRADMFGSPSTDNSAKDRITMDGANSFIKSLFTKKESEEAAEFIKNIAACMSPSIRLEKGPVTRAVMTAEKEGTILIADELNLSDPNTFSGAFNGLTDKHTTEYNIAGLGVVKLSDKLIIGGTQNGTGGAYVGTKVQNQATMSRFNVIKLDAPGSILKILKENKHIEKINGMSGMTNETQINAQSGGVKLVRQDKPEAKFDFKDYEERCMNIGRYQEHLDVIYQDFQLTVESGEVQEDCLNVRGFERALGHILLGQSIKDALCECVINSCVEDMRTTLKTLVENRGEI